MTERKASTPRPGKVFILYDGRAKFGDTDHAAVLVTASSEREAWRDSGTFRDYDAVWFEYDLVAGETGQEAVNENVRPDIGKGLLL